MMYFSPRSLFLCIIANSADPDEMPPYLSFHLGLQCLPMYLLSGIENEKGLILSMIKEKFFKKTVAADFS